MDCTLYRSAKFSKLIIDDGKAKAVCKDSSIQDLSNTEAKQILESELRSIEV